MIAYSKNVRNTPIHCVDKLQVITGTASEIYINPLKPNDAYMGRTAPLTSKIAFYIFIQQY